MEEISLREYIEVLLRGKRLIAIITIVSILLSALVSVVILKPTYEATAVLLANPIQSNPKDLSGNLDGVIDALNQYPEMGIDTYREQFRSPTVLLNTINELNLVDDDEEPMRPEDLGEKIALETVENTNLLRVTVTDKDPALATQIANTLGQKFIQFISDNTRKRGTNAAQAIEEQLIKEEEKLSEQTQILKEYLANSRSIEELKQEVSALVSQITSYKQSLNRVEKDIASDRDALKVLTRGKGTATGINLDEDIKVNIPVSGGEITQELQLDTRNMGSLEESLITIKATEVETRLVQNVSQQNALQAKITEMENRLREAQSTLAQEEYKYNAIQRNYNLAQQAYNAYLDRHKEAVIAAASDIGTATIIVSSPAIEPIDPASPNKKLNVAIGAVLGLMIGVFVVFFKEYWETSGEQK